MEKINKLTPEQAALLPEYARRWTEIGLSTAPADRAEAERGIAQAYELAGLPAPRVMWVGSPYAMVLAGGLLKAIVETMDDPGQVRGQVSRQVRGQVSEQVSEQVFGQVSGQVSEQVFRQVIGQVFEQVIGQVFEQVSGQVFGQVIEQVSEQVSELARSLWRWDTFGFGAHDAGWLSFYAFFREVVGLKEQTEKLTGLLALARSVGWYLPFRGLCIMSERHGVLHRDEQGRLHCEDGPAVGYPDGYAIYAIHGRRVPAQVILSPETLTVKQIDDERNAEVRRVMIERFGPARYLLDSGAEVVSQDDYGTLYRREIANDEPLVMVKVVNSTAEPDGSYKDYWLRVPPGIKTAREAVAWTFGIEDAEHYAPLVET